MKNSSIYGTIFASPFVFVNDFFIHIYVLKENALI